MVPLFTPGQDVAVKDAEPVSAAPVAIKIVMVPEQLFRSRIPTVCVPPASPVKTFDDWYAPPSMLYV